MLPDKIDLKLRDLKEEIYEDKVKLKKWTIQEVKKTNYNKYVPINEEKTFLTGDQSFWDNTGKIFFFRYNLELPEKLDQKDLYLHINISGECTLFINDEVYRGINEQDIKLPNIDNSVYKFKILATHDVHLSARHQRMFNVPYPPHIFRSAFLFSKNKNIERLYYLLKNIKKTMEILDTKQDKLILKELLEDGLNRIDFFTTERDNFLESINNSYQFLINKLNSINNNSSEKVFLLAHSHLDLAFKWTISDTIRKLERTISTTLNLMDSYDDYYFIKSQAILFNYLKDYYPGLFKKLKKKINDNKFLIEGSFWVEADLNLTNGESLIRQILYGKKFTKNYFNKKSNIAWLPDCFGFSAILPQILKKANIDYLITTKLQWNDTNVFPYNIFKWEGIDGTKIDSYLLTDEYGGNLDPKKIKDSWENRKQKDLKEVLSLYGFGDGGGGNTEFHFNNLEAIKNIPYLPNIKTGDINNHLKNIFNSEYKLPVWKGELYLEKHRGTYTSQAELKKYNRNLEFLLRNIELLFSLAKIAGYKKEHDLESLWKVLLKNQFHDILPGSSISKVVEEAINDYQNIEEELNSIKKELMEFFTEKVGLKEKEILIFNPLSFPINNLFSLEQINLDEDYNSVRINNKYYPIQKDETSIYFKLENIKPFNFSKIELVKNEYIEHDNNLFSNKYELENKYIKVKLDKQGEIKSIYDKENNIEYIEPNKTANQLILYDDKSTYFDTWDISISEDNKRNINSLKNIKVKNSGPYFHSIEIKRKFYSSTITQEIILYENKRKIDFKTQVDWQEKQKLLKTFFPINMKNSKALFDLSMGHIERANYKNTTWEKAKTEVPAHKWINLSNKDMNVSVLNSSKYGHEVEENVMNLTLLKSGIYPDPKADTGKHQFTYSLLLNPEEVNVTELEKEALMMNNKPLVNYNREYIKYTKSDQYRSLINIPNDNIILDSFKPSENKNGYILRVHEIKGIKDKLKIEFNEDLKQIFETDLLENNINNIHVEENIIKQNIAPFEIKTFRIIFQ